MQETDLQDESIQELASILREMLEEIGRQSLQVASLILPWAGNYVPLLLYFVDSNNVAFVGHTVKNQIPTGLKSRIVGCRKSCAYLKDHLSNRIRVDANTQVHQNSMYLLA
jgi:hypothetical protein